MQGFRAPCLTRNTAVVELPLRNSMASRLMRKRSRWRMTADDRDRIARGVETMRRAMTTSPFVSIEVEDLEARVSDLTRVGGHHIGTARMASVPQEGVVDADCAVFGTQGLFVSGSAAFPTSGFANPTLTIVAMALRLGDHLRKSP